MFGKKEIIDREKILETVGEALNRDGENGKVGVYSSSGKIIFWDMLHKEDIMIYQKEISEVKCLFYTLLEYLGLAIKKEGRFTICKKEKKNK